MEANFGIAFRFSMGYEKWKADIPGDSGGLSIWGITSKWWPEQVKAMLDMTESESMLYAKGFYHRTYWMEAGCPEIASGLDIAVFDTAVKWKSKPAEFLKICHDVSDFIMLRIAYEADLKSQFMVGWLNRDIALWKFVKGII
jgi:lysozyme family protein